MTLNTLALALAWAAALGDGTWRDETDFCPLCHTAGFTRRSPRCRPARSETA